MAFELGNLIYRLSILGASNVVANLQRVGAATQQVSTQGQRMADTLSASAGDVTQKLSTLGQGMGNVTQKLAAQGQAVGDVTQKLSAQGQQMADTFDALDIPLLRVSTAALTLASSLGKIVMMLSALSGVRVAAQLQMTEVGFATLLGSAEKARALTTELRRMGTRTPFETMRLIDIAMMLMASGFPAERIMQTMKAIGDVAAATGGGTEKFARVALALQQIRNAPRLMGGEIRQLFEAGIPTREALAAVGATVVRKGGREVVMVGGVEPTGAEVADLLIEGFRKRFGGFAEAVGMNTLAGILQNLRESLRFVMLPTANLLLPALQLIANLFRRMVDAAQSFNEATGGGAGLVFLFGLVARGWTLLVGSLLYAANAVRQLTIKLQELAAVSLGAAGASALGANARQAIPAFGGIRNAIRAAGLAGLLRVLWPMLRNFLRNPLGLGFAASVGGEFLGGAIGGPIGAALKGAGMGAGFASIIAPFFGAFAPLILAAGALIGGGVSLWQSLRTPNRAEEATARNTERTAKALEEINISLIGGGRRGRATIASVEVEAAMARALGMGGA